MHGRFVVGWVRCNQEANLMKNNLSFNTVHCCWPVGSQSCFSSHSTPPSFCFKFAITLVLLSFLPLLKYHFHAFLHPLCSPFVFKHSFAHQVLQILSDSCFVVRETALSTVKYLSVTVWLTEHVLFGLLQVLL